MQATTPAQKRMVRRLTAIFADPRARVGGVVPEEIKPYLGGMAAPTVPARPSNQPTRSISINPPVSDGESA